MITLYMYESDSLTKQQWYHNFTKGWSYDRVEWLFVRGMAWGGEFKYSPSGLFPNRIEFEDDKDATAFLLRWS
jgi:hypothetical protein